MGRISVQNVTKQFGGQIVLDDVSLELSTGEIVGLVGPNGAGKTTLFRMLAGLIPPDLGTVTRSKGLELGYLAQDPQVGLENSLHDEVMSAFSDLLALEQRLHRLSEQMAEKHDAPELHGLMEQYDRTNAQFVAAGGYEFEQRVNEILGGLDFAPADYALPVAVLSGGQKCRAALAKLLLEDKAFLLLDEPTNHLDIDAVRWLEKFLAGHHGGAVVISHDRYLLDRICERIVEVDRRKLHSYPGNYSNYVQVKQVRRLTQQRQFEKDREFIAKERDFIARHMAGQRTKEAQGRLKRLERQLAAGEFVLEAPTQRRTLKLKFDEQESRSATVLYAEQLSKAFGAKVLFRDLRMQVDRGQRLGITGPNGTGKSTLLKILLGKTPADSGHVEFDRKVSIGYYAQEPEALDPGQSLLDHLRTARPMLDELEARSLLARFLFTGDDVFKPLGKLSGGEQSRLRLLKLIIASPNVLVFDEPTNHLDIPSREALEEALQDFPGTIIVVSHDRYFLDRIANRLMVMRDGGATTFSGNYSFYIEQIERKRAAADDRDKPGGGPGPAAARRKPQPAPPRKKQAPPSQTHARLMRLSTGELEAHIGSLETRLKACNAAFGDAELYKDPAALNRQRQEFEQLQQELAAAEEIWLSRSE